MKTSRPARFFIFTFLLNTFAQLCLVFLLFAPLIAGAQTPDTAQARREVENLLERNKAATSQKEFTEALRIIAQGEETAQNAFGKTSAEYASCLFYHGRTLQFSGDLNGAEPYYLEAQAIQEQHLAQTQPFYTSLLNNLANLYLNTLRFAAAEETLLKAMSIRDRNDPTYSRLLHNLGNLYLQTGKYDRAEQHFVTALTLRAQNPGKQSQDYVTTLNSLAALYHSIGRYEVADTLYRETLMLWNKKHPDYAAIRGNLAQLNIDMGRYDVTEAMYREVIAELGEQHDMYAISLNNLANLFQKTGRYDEAEALYHRVLALQESRQGKAHPDYAQTLNNLAALYVVANRHSEAEALFRDAMATREATLGKQHPDYAASVGNLANLYYFMRRYAEAEPLFLEALAIREKAVGEEHPNYIANLNSLALLYEAWNKPELAAQYFLSANKGRCALIERASRFFSEYEMLAYIAKYETEFHQFQVFAQQHPSPECTSAAYDNVLLLHGFLLENIRYLARAIAGADAGARATYDRWQATQRRLYAEYTSPVVDRNNIKALEAESEEFEKTLARSFRAFTAARRTPRWQEVRDHLLPGEAAIEFVRYNLHTPDPTNAFQYAALLLRPGYQTPLLILLCEEQQLEAVMTGSDHIGALASKVQNLYAARSGATTSLYALIWAPIEKALAGQTPNRIFYTPAGMLHRINLEAVAWDKSGRTLADRYPFVRLGSTREITTDRLTQNRKPTSAFICGGIRYDMDHAAISRANADLAVSMPDTAGSAIPVSVSDSTLGNSWRYLPGTTGTVLGLNDLLQKQAIPATVRLGHSVTEEAFKYIGQNGPSPSLIHTGTHGFFYDPQDAASPQKYPSAIEESVPVFKISGHPMIRSGLILAGANYAWEHKRSMPDLEDGILTAFEVTQMNLSNTELVVLSACETGLGDIKGSEGVYGLQRAFRIAGAKNVMMSLWEAPEKATQLLMDEFYKNWLQNNMSIREALQTAQASVRNFQDEHKVWLYQNPYYWAGFVLVGG
jgi:CHAT domain-containing protein/tetratricopeptide (TPR) repeat protein